MFLKNYNIFIKPFLIIVFLIFVNICIAQEYGEQKVVYHINYEDEGLQARTLNSIQNHINAVGENNIEVVAILHGGGVMLLHKDNKESMLSKIDILRFYNVRFRVCGRTLETRNINYKTDLVDVSEQDIVSSVLEEFVLLKMNGFKYIKPY